MLITKKAQCNNKFYEVQKKKKLNIKQIKS